MGYYRIRTCGMDNKRLWNMCAYHGVDIWDLEFGKESYFLSVSKKDLGVFSELVKKTDVKYSVESEHGFPHMVDRFRKNLTFFLGLLTALGLMTGLSQFVWSIQIVGNTGYGDEELLRFMKIQNVVHGMWKQKVACSELAASLREYFPNITWVTVKIEGTNLVVEMKENILDSDRLSVDEESADENADENGEEIQKEVSGENKNYDSQEDKTGEPGNLVAEKDGVIVQMITRSGVPLVTPGMECKKGDVLVEGVVPIYNDSKEVVRYEYVDADADISIQTTYAYYDEFDRNYEKAVYEHSEYSYFLQAGKWRFGKAAEDDKTVEDKEMDGEGKTSETGTKQIKESHQLTLTDTFLLPVYYGTEEERVYQITDSVYTEEECENLANTRLNRFLSDLEKKGVQIYENNVKIVMTDAKCMIKGEIVVVESAFRKETFSPETYLTVQSQEE